jgi:hypothetical protein
VNLCVPQHNPIKVINSFQSLPHPRSLSLHPSKTTIVIDLLQIPEIGTEFETSLLESFALLDLCQYQRRKQR